jgi:hypothetical protein
MNRHDEIQATARDCADWVCADPADRNAMANDLIKLVTLIVGATGKYVAVDGEGDIGQGDCTCERPEGCSGGCTNPEHDAKAHNRYLTGERIQTAAREIEDASTRVDLERYERSGLAPVWQPRGNAQRLAGALTQAAAQAADAMQQGGVTTLQTWDGRVLRTVHERDAGCTWIPGDATPACDHDRDCPVHGVAAARAATATCPDHGTVTCPKDSDCHRVMGDDSPVTHRINLDDVVPLGNPDPVDLSGFGARCWGDSCDETCPVHGG